MNKKFTITERADFKLTLTARECQNPEGLTALDFVREEFDQKGELTNTSVYNFYLEPEELAHLGGCLLSISKDTW
jgi:hypothetical protein